MELWERQAEETETSYLWFSRYRDYGPERSIAKLVQKYGRKKSYKSQLDKWSSQYRWQERIVAYERHLDEQKRTTLENERLQMAREHIEVADRTMEVFLKLLAAIDTKNVNPSAAKSLGEFAVKTKRDALGVVEEHRITGELNVNDRKSVRLSEELLAVTQKLLSGVKEDNSDDQE